MKKGVFFVFFIRLGGTMPILYKKKRMNKTNLPSSVSIESSLSLDSSPPKLSQSSFSTACTRTKELIIPGKDHRKANFTSKSLSSSNLHKFYIFTELKSFVVGVNSVTQHFSYYERLPKNYWKICFFKKVFKKKTLYFPKKSSFFFFHPVATFL